MIVNVSVEFSASKNIPLKVSFDPAPGSCSLSISYTFDFFCVAELVERVVLLGGSALSPWAIQRDPLMVKRRVADQTGCPGDVETDDIAPCLRLRNLEDLLAVQLDPPRFTSGFAPFMDGAVMPPPSNQVIDVHNTFLFYSFLKILFSF